MEDQLISGITNKLAKEKGFDNTIRHLVDYQREYVDPRGEGIGEYYSEKKWVREYVHPTQSLLQKWLREVHNIQVTIEFWNASSHNHKWKIQFHDEKVKINKTIFGYYCESYEDALEQGLQEALKEIPQS